MESIKSILNFIRPQRLTRIFHNSKLLMQFESSQPKDIIFTLDTRAELNTFKNSEHETDS